ncbi:PRC-barrel domain-containing protein [Nitrosovibrio tenuis]|uniref:Sporulation protein YlmC, PRC-barrel domain family n=1 Tax=Nitrosovibrio tenuis TaxID=1233 RepID=A0A1H7RGA4_9PROT|nr:PRC-barrel domain-containing protein [Nitrosovibrio tenuis]SEL59370.1 Sporulation protein YlmC, PRC-barrel domain family [Nitrosovibrio tenuis]
MKCEDPHAHDEPKASNEEAPTPPLMRAATLIGENVYNLEGIELGEIKDIMLDAHAGRIAYAVLSFGGFLGIADKLFAVPWKALKPDAVHKQFLLDVDKKQLESAPGFDKDHWPDMADPTWQNKVHSYYRIKPFREPGDSPDIPYDDTPYTNPPVEKETQASNPHPGRGR